MGQSCSCFGSAGNPEFNLDILPRKINPSLSIELSTRQATIQHASFELEPSSTDSLQLSESEPGLELDSGLITLNQLEDWSAYLVLQAFHSHLARLMQVKFGERELSRRKKGRAAIALRKLPEFDSGYDREELDRVKLVFLDEGAIYQGIQSSQGRAAGYGIAYNTDGSVYEGDWKDGMYSGLGRLVYDEDHFYEGDFCSGLFSGMGRYCKEGFKYTGQWLLGYAHGNGCEVNEGSYSYDGDYVKGVKSGKGTRKFADGGTYVGDFKDNFFEGFGFRAWSDKLYAGNWVQGKKHGEGTMSYISGEKYQGNFTDDSRHGRGALTFKSGDVYVGEWVNGDVFGEGELRLTDGVVLRGQWSLEQMYRFIYNR